MLIIEVKDDGDVIIKAEGNIASVNSDLAIGIKAFHDSMVKREDSELLKAVVHGAVLKAVELAYNAIDD